MFGNQQLCACVSITLQFSGWQAIENVLWSNLQPQCLTSSHLAQCLFAMALMASLGCLGAVKEEPQEGCVPWLRQELMIFYILYSHVHWDWFPFPPFSRAAIPKVPVRQMMLHLMAKRSRFLRGWQLKWRRPGIGWPKWHWQFVTTCHNMSQCKLAKPTTRNLYPSVPRFARSPTWGVGFGNSWVPKMARRVSYWLPGLN